MTTLTQLLRRFLIQVFAGFTVIGIAWFSADIVPLRLRAQEPAPEVSRPEDNNVDVANIRAYSIPADQLQRVTQALTDRFGNSTDVKLSPDVRTSQLLVLARPAVHREISGLLQRLPRSASVEESSIEKPLEERVSFKHTLKHISIDHLHNRIRQIFGSEIRSSSDATLGKTTLHINSPKHGMVRMQVDHTSQGVLVETPKSRLQSWQRLLLTLDFPFKEMTHQQQSIPLRNANLKQIKDTISFLRAAERREIAQGLQPPEGGTNSDVDQKRQNLDEPETGQLGLIGNVQVEVIPELDVIILRGNKKDVQRVMEVIAEIEKQSTVNLPEIKVYHLQHVESQALSGIITTLYATLLAPRSGLVSITPLVKPNALLLIGPAEGIRRVEELVGKLDQKTVNPDELQVIRLKHMSAEDAEEKIETFYAEREGLDTRVKVISDFRSNALVVQASPRDMKEIQQLIAELDVATSPAVNEVRVFRLKNTRAETLAPVLQGAFQGSSGTSTAGAAPNATSQRVRSAVLQMTQIDSEKGKLIKSGILSDVTVQADTTGNALLVTGPPQSMELIEMLIQQLDRMPDAEAQIKVFTIVNGDATNLTLMLQQLFGLPATAGAGTTSGVFVGQSLQQTNGNESSLVPLRFAVDVRTNSIIATGSVGDLSVVEALLLRLDEGDIETRKIVVYRLKNAPALDVANSITTFLQSQRELIQQQLLFNQAISPFEQIEREVIVVPEVVTNTLIVSATPRYFEQVIEMIKELDFRPPMVMVQVVIAEVVLDNFKEHGMEFGLQDSLLFDRGIFGFDPATGDATNLTPGFNFNNADLGNSPDAVSLATRAALASQGLSSFGVGRLNTDRGYGGLVISAANESVQILIRALHEAGKLQILSRPQVMTLDNQAAFIQIGQRVPRIVASTVTDTGAVINSTQDEDVGILLRVQARINQDGLVVMALDAEKSQLGEAADGVPVAVDINGNPVFSPPIETTTAQTTISAYSDQTVVFAGLITNRKSQRTRRIPYLSDIPLLGKAFEYETKDDRRTELLIFMTPKIVQADSDYDSINYAESERMSWCLADVTEMHGDVGLVGRSDLFCRPNAFGKDCQVIYPHIDPSGTMFMMEPEAVFPAAPPSESGVLPRLDGPSPRLEFHNPILPTPAPAIPDQSDHRQRNQHVQPAGHALSAREPVRLKHGYSGSDTPRPIAEYRSQPARRSKNTSVKHPNHPDWDPFHHEVHESSNLNEIQQKVIH